MDWNEHSHQERSVLANLNKKESHKMHGEICGYTEKTEVIKK